MSTRLYQDKDFYEVVSVLREAFPECDISLNSGDLSLGNEYMQVVYEKEKSIVGYALVNKRYDPIIKRWNYWIEYVCVSSKYRRQGIGKELMRYIEEVARDNNVLYLQLTSSRVRTEARKMYSDLGFILRESDIFRKVL